MVDQSHERKLVLSRPVEHDRRLRVIRLTADGVRLRRGLVAGSSQNPAIDGLMRRRQDQLLEILREVS